MCVIRWLLLPPAVIGIWYAVFAMALFGHFHLERSLCPPEDLVSGHCANASIHLLLEILMHFSVGLSAVAVCLAAAAIAPAHKVTTVGITFAGGLLIAGFLALAAKAWSLFLAAALPGLLCTLAIVIFLRAKTAPAGNG
ncbi:MAG: hypothetical protein FIB06_01485 [Betaproteobacteria bacterium]|nr:hypothetical protein [Betaproteobacteria bacterium]